MSLRALAVVAVVSCAAACGGGSSDSKGSGGANSTGGSSGAAGSGGLAGSPPCSEDPAEIPAGASCLLSVSGTVVDGNGAPVPGLLMSVCGSVCWYGKTETSGAFTVPIGVHLLPELFSTLVHGRPNRTSFYWPLPPTAKDAIEVGELTALDLPTTGAPLVVRTDKQGAPAQTVTNGDVTLTVAAGTQIKLDVEDVVLGDEGKLFRALAIPADKRDKFVDPTLDMISVYALTPFEASVVDETTVESALAQVSLKNVTALPAGTAVEFLALGSYLFEDWVKPAAFEVVATGKVSSDGSSIDMDAGQGLKYLTWVGVRKK